jgi:hypothetical protein
MLNPTPSHIFYEIFNLGASMLAEHGDPLILSKLKALIVTSTHANHGSSLTPISQPCVFSQCTTII